MSPDGRSIAFTLFDRLWLLPADGGTARPLTGPAEYSAHAPPSAWPVPGLPAWSPDGEWLAYASPAGLRLLRPLDGARQELTFQWDDAQPRWRAAGEVSFVARRAWTEDRRGWPIGDPQLWVIDVGSGEQQPISPRFTRIGGYAWSPDRRLVAVSGTPPGDSAGVWLVDPERQVLLGRILDGADLGTLAWGADGRLLVVRQLAHNEYEIVVRVLSGDGAAVSPRATGTLGGGADVRSLSPQPDGSVVYAADGRIWRSAAGVREPVPFRATVPVVRPAYQRKVPTLGTGSGKHDVRIAVAPAISPDGERIAFSALGRLWVLGRDGEIAPITADSLFPQRPAWSPDGRRIAFEVPSPEGARVWVAHADGSGARLLTDLTGAQTQPRWSPDGRRVAFKCHPGCAPGMSMALGWASANGDTIRIVHGERRERVAGWRGMAVAGWTGDGSAIVFYGRRPYGADAPERAGGPHRAVPWDGRLWAVPADSGAALPWGPVLGMHSPLVVADGASVLYQAEGAVWRIAAGPAGVGDETRPERLADEPGDWPTASTDGRYVTYLSPEGLTRLNTGTGVVERLRLPLAYTLRPPPARVVKDVRLFDGTGAGPTGRVDVWMAEGRISRIVPSGSESPPGGIEVVDGGGAFALPGLIDGHFHPFSPAALQESLSEGVTTARELGTADLPSILALREAVEAGRIRGPRLLVAGEALTSLEGEEHARRYATRAARLGADLLKLYSIALPTVDVIRAAHEAGLPVISHGEGALVGLDGKEHAFGTRFYEDWVQLHARAGLPLGTTMVIIMDIEHYASPDLTVIHEFASDGLDLIRRVHEAGGSIIAGTDAGSLHRELELLVLAGLPPAAALHAATGGAARILGIDGEVGTISPGKLADLIILEPGADPLSDIRDTGRIQCVIQGGRIVDVDREDRRYPQ